MTEIPIHYLLAGACYRTHTIAPNFHGRLYFVTAHIWVTSSRMRWYLYLGCDYAGANGKVFGTGESPVEYYV